jgi:hypothetical protein
LSLCSYLCISLLRVRYRTNIQTFKGEEKMKSKRIIFTVIFVLLQLCGSLWAWPTTAYEARMVVTGWLKANPKPLDVDIGGKVAHVETFTDEYGGPLYYIVYLEPSGFVIVSGNDLVEPIIGFADDGFYEPSPENPLGALVTNDLNARISKVAAHGHLQIMAQQASPTATQSKWRYLIDFAEDPDDQIGTLAVLADRPPRPPTFDFRVSPLVKSKWDQGGCKEKHDPSLSDPFLYYVDCDTACYNYYTPTRIVSYRIGRQVFRDVQWDAGNPDNYPCGCVATAMAQLMRYHKYPEAAIGQHDFSVDVNDGSFCETVQRCTRGGDGDGGPYNWSQMTLNPNCDTPSTEREAIGALCYDASISVNTTYWPKKAGADILQVADALSEVFKYGSAIKGWNDGNDIGPGLLDMINPNLDAGLPVILGIRGPGRGHAVLVDGYLYELVLYPDGYQLYHHLNMGWSGICDAYYNLPHVHCSEQQEDYEYDLVSSCVYNICPWDTIVFEDTFPSTTIDPNKWASQPKLHHDSEAPSPPYCVDIHIGSSMSVSEEPLETSIIDMSQYASAKLSFYCQEIMSGGLGGLLSRKRVNLSFWDGLSWIELPCQLDPGRSIGKYSHYIANLPSEALHKDLQILFTIPSPGRQMSLWSIDLFIDDIRIEAAKKITGGMEIISGRVTQREGVWVAHYYPVDRAIVTAEGPGGPYSTLTNSNGIYALKGLKSGSEYCISVTKEGRCFEPKCVETGTSVDGNSVSGNRWEVDFVSTCLIPGFED